MHYHNSDNITSLYKNQVFVFGSNQAGIHVRGAALIAKNNFNARTRVSEGPTGQAYALPTKDVDGNPLPLWKITGFVCNFLAYANENNDKEFFVTRLNHCLTGYTDRDIAIMFRPSDIGDNVILPIEWKKYIEQFQQQLELSKEKTNDWYIGLDYGIFSKNDEREGIKNENR